MYINSFSFRHDEDNGLLTDAVCVVYVELSKLDEIIKKSVNDMTDLEKWAVFFQYASVPTHRETVNKVIDSKEALQIACSLLMSISQDERERAVFRSRRMYQTDRESDIATAEDRGRHEGRLEGRHEGRHEGIKEGIINVAKRLIIRNRPISEIMEDTGLTYEEIESLSRTASTND
jgi:predicted transposase/invertase (TIGR01784 family)